MSSTNDVREAVKIIEGIGVSILVSGTTCTTFRVPACVAQHKAALKYIVLNKLLGALIHGHESSLQINPDGTMLLTSTYPYENILHCRQDTGGA